MFALDSSLSELCKCILVRVVVLILCCVYRRSWLNLRLGYFGSKSVFAPLLLARGGGRGPILSWERYSAVCLHPPSALDSWLEIFYEGLENFPQLYIGFYFYSEVNQSGTDAFFWLSFAVTFVSSFKLVFSASELSVKTWKSREAHSPTHSLQSLSHPLIHSHNLPLTHLPSSMPQEDRH